MSDSQCPGEGRFAAKQVGKKQEEVVSRAFWSRAWEFGMVEGKTGDAKISNEGRAKKAPL